MSSISSKKCGPPPAPFPLPYLGSATLRNDGRWIQPSLSFAKCSEIYLQFIHAQLIGTNGTVEYTVNLNSGEDSTQVTCDENHNDQPEEEVDEEEGGLQVSDEWRKRLIRTSKRMEERKKRRK